MTPDEVEAIRERAKGPLHQALHDLDVRITGLNREGCHCNLVAEVALDALAPTLAALAEAQRDWDPPCTVCGCKGHSCAADCDCCPEHGADLRQPGRVVTVQRWMALDLHIALGHLVDHEAQYQGRRSWADWWADLCGAVRRMQSVIEAARAWRAGRDPATSGMEYQRRCKQLEAALDTYETQTGGTE